jgi:hypothetical protein
MTPAAATHGGKSTDNSTGIISDNCVNESTRVDDLGSSPAGVDGVHELQDGHDGDDDENDMTMITPAEAIMIWDIIMRTVERSLKYQRQ